MSRIRPFIAGGPYPLKPAYSGEMNLVCPICQHDYVHLGPVTVHQDHQRTIVSDQGTKLELSREKGSHGRGSEIDIVCWCEGGHEWVMRLCFHKGVSLLSLTDINQTVDGESTWRESELWRS